MASRKAGGSAKNLSDSNAQYLGIKLYAGERAKQGNVIVRQRGSRILPGVGVLMGKDHTLFARKDGIVSYSQKRQTHFNGKVLVKKIVNVK